jgi:hypothetical protein
MLPALVLSAAAGNLYADAQTVCRIGGVSGQAFGGGWDELAPFRTAACVFLTYCGSTTPFPDLAYGDPDDGGTEDSFCVGQEPQAVNVAARWSPGADRILYYRHASGQPSDALTFQHALVSLLQWAGAEDPPFKASAMDVWARELTGDDPTMLPGKPRAAGNCDADRFGGRETLATGDLAAHELFEAKYVRGSDAKFLSASLFAAIGGRGGVTLWCLDDEDCGSDELVCRQGPPTMPGMCARLSSVADTDADVAQAVSIVLIVTAAVLALGMLVWTARNKKTR